MIKVLADALVPIFAGLLLGYIAGLRRRHGQSKRSKSHHLRDELCRPLFALPGHRANSARGIA